MTKTKNLPAMALALLKAGIISEKDLPKSYRIEVESEPHKVKDLPTTPFGKPPECEITDKKDPPAPMIGADEEENEDEGEDVPRVRGQMVWLHKTAPILEIEGRPRLTPEEIASGRRR